MYTPKPIRFQPTNSNRQIVKTPSQTNANKPPLLPLPSASTRFQGKPYPHVPADVKAENIAKGLCYYFDQKYDRDHKCNFRGTQIFTVEVSSIVQKDGTSNEEVDLETSEEMEPFIVEPKILVNALTGNQDIQTMRVVGRINNTRIHILIDSGSTHNFLDYSFA